MNTLFAMLLLLIFFAVVLFIGFFAGVLVATQMKSTQEGQKEEKDDEKCPHGNNWDDCPDYRH